MYGRTSKSAHNAFTLVELLVVIAIIGILVSLTMPAIQSAREAGRKASCKNNIRQLQTGMVSYEESRRVFPAGRDGCDKANADVCYNVRTSYIRAPSGFVTILPYLEEQALHQSLDFEKSFWHHDSLENNGTPPKASSWHPPNLAAIRYQMPLMRCPSDQSERTWTPTESQFQDDLEAAVGSYAMCAGTNGPPSVDSATRKFRNTGVFNYVYETKAALVRDGLSKTVFLGEVALGHTRQGANRWTGAARNTDTLRNTTNPLNQAPGTGLVTDLYGYKTNGAFGSSHLGGAHFAFGDTRTVFIPDEIDAKIYNAIATRAGGEEHSYLE